MNDVSTSRDHARFIRKLECVADLSEIEKQALLSLPLSVESLPGHHELVGERARENRCCLLLDGFVHRYKTLSNGARQILAYHLPGDIPDLFSLHLHTMDHSIGTLVPSRVAFIEHQKLIDLAREHAGIAIAFWRDTLIDAGIFREWIVNIGQRSIRGRLAHLFCEVDMRAECLGLKTDNRYVMPLSTVEIADATGLSRVDVRRALQDLQANGVIAAEDSTIEVLNRDRLRQIAQFDPSYLHLRVRPAA